MLSIANSPKGAKSMRDKILTDREDFGKDYCMVRGSLARRRSLAVDLDLALVPRR